MDWITGMQKAIDYIEEHITDKLDYEEIAKISFSSSYHFQRVFSILCGYTLGEYIRCRRLSLAGEELASGKCKVIDVAIKYGYESPDSFTKAFQRFHGITPSAAREPGAKLRSFTRLTVKISLEGGSNMNYRIEEKPKMCLHGYKQRFTGVPYGEARAKQEEKMYVSTRAKQWLLRGPVLTNAPEYCVVDNIDSEGYDFYIAYDLTPRMKTDLYNPEVTGVDFMDKLDFEDIDIPKQTYAIFETSRSSKPMGEYVDIRKRIVSEWLPGSGYQLADAPEVVVTHWKPVGGKENRFVEIWLPVQK